MVATPWSNGVDVTWCRRDTFGRRSAGRAKTSGISIAERLDTISVQRVLLRAIVYNDYKTRKRNTALKYCRKIQSIILEGGSADITLLCVCVCVKLSFFLTANETAV